MDGTVVVAEDEAITRRNVCKVLTDEGLTVHEASTGSEALELVQKVDVDVVVTDIMMPGLDGISLLKRVREILPQTFAIVTTAHASVDTAVQALRLGAQDYLRKPVILSELIHKIERLLSHKNLVRENQMLRREVNERVSHGDVVGRSKAIRDVLTMVEKAAPSHANVLISGESGVGKEVVARMLHEHSRRSDKIFLPVNCSAIPEALLESQLFGHVRGSFTGAVNAQEGLFQRARQGTIFLDEIGDMPLNLQPKILRAIEERRVLPVGSTKHVGVDARIIAATHRNLVQEIANERFREDLYYRLNVVNIRIPSLRDRRSDIPILTNHLMRRHNREMNRSYKGVSSAAMKVLTCLPWNGNVRELDNVIERAMILGNDEWIEAEDLPRVDPKESEHQHLPVGYNLEDALKRYEKKHIEQVLKEVSNDRTRAAGLLGMSRSTLYRKMERLGL